MEWSKVFLRNLSSLRFFMPMDTGNWRHNAVKGYHFTEKMVFKVDYSVAPYAYFQNYGLGWSSVYEGVIDKAFATVRSEINEMINSKRRLSQRYKYRQKMVNESRTTNTSQRELRKIQSMNRARGIVRETGTVKT